MTFSDGRVLCGYCYKHEAPVMSRESLEKSYFHARNLLNDKGFAFPRKIKVSLVSKDYFTKQGLHSSWGQAISYIGGMEQRHEIKVMIGLPFIMCCAIMAHEMLHVWQNTHGLRPEPEICEGLCELGSALVYKRAKTPLSNVLLNNLENNLALIYSQGFLKMKEILVKEGWEATRLYVKQNSKVSY
jgi:hypothetical protein